MTQAFGVQGRTLSEQKAEELLPGWLAAFRGVATEHLEKVRADGLAIGCKTAEQFVTVYEAGINARASEIDEQNRRAKLARQRAAATGAMTPGRARAIEEWKRSGIL